MYLLRLGPGAFSSCPPKSRADGTENSSDQTAPLAPPQPLTVLVDQHPDGDPRHVEPIQEVLNTVLGVVVDVVRVLQLEDPLRHGLDDVGVPVPYPHEGITEKFHSPRAHVTLFELHDLLEAPHVPVVHCDDGGHPQEVLGEEGYLFHDVRQPDRQLLAEEDEGFLFRGVQTCVGEKKEAVTDILRGTRITLQ